jgi:5-oxoprolinase (ATP-hydrolysing) subunit A
MSDQKHIDLNCDMGESTASTIIGNDAGIMPFITSANIACGFHGGSPTVMRDTILLALKHGVAIGAHPSFPDLEGFGRREMNLPPNDIYAMVVYQVGAIKSLTEALGGRLHHVKPHGALYNMAARDSVISEAIVRAIRDIDPGLMVYGLSGATTIDIARQMGQPFAQEVFADRGYESDGKLTPRDRPGALLPDADAALAQSMLMVRKGKVTATDGRSVSLAADTICIHGDGPHALAIAKALHDGLQAAGIILKSFTSAS